MNLKLCINVTRNVEVEPVSTMRVHTDSVLAIAAIKPEHSQTYRNGLFVTGGRDGSIALMSFPTIENDRSDPYSYEGIYKFHL